MRRFRISRQTCKMLAFRGRAICRQHYLTVDQLFSNWGVWVPLIPPMSSPKKFRKHSSNKCLIKICILCTLPYEFPPAMRIPMPNPMGSGDHPDPLIFKFVFAVERLAQPRYNFKGVPLSIVRKLSAHTLIGLDYLHRIAG